MSGAYRDRLFRPGDVRRILRRAAEIEDAAPSDRAAGRPQTLDEIARTAADAGISDVALQRALAEDGPKEGAASAPPEPWSWSGAPGRIAIERTVARPLSPQSHGKLVKVMRRAVGELGNPQAFGDSLSWSATLRPSGGGRDLHAVVEPGERGTVVRIEENLNGLRGGLMGGVVGGVGGGGLGVVAPLFAAFAPFLLPFAIPLWVLVVYLLARRLYQARFRAREAQLRALADTLVAELNAGPAEGPVAAAPAANVRVAQPVETSEEPETDDAARATRAANR